MFIDIDAVAAEVTGCTMLDEVAQKLGHNIQRVMGLDCIEIVTAAGTVMVSEYYCDGRRSIELGYI
jgi:hypothetical protein